MALQALPAGPTPYPTAGYGAGSRTSPTPTTPPNTMSGFIQFVGGDEYGSLYITHVNGEDAPQYIPAAPKAAYPYRRDGIWTLVGAIRVDAYVKYDGTNICQYSYGDAAGNRHTTFKLRVRPFVPPRFKFLLDRAFLRYPGVREARLPEGREWGCLVYELYGRENPMLVRYDEDIELRYLFGRSAITGDIIPPPTNIPNEYAVAPNSLGIDCPQAEHTMRFLPHNLAPDYYVRKHQHDENTRWNGNLEMYEGIDGGPGTEGDMLYVRFPDEARPQTGEFTRLIKLKASGIEGIHHTPEHVPTEEVRSTAVNMWESTDDPQIADLLVMLAEEWNDDQIGRSMPVIERVYQRAIIQRETEDKVLALYHQYGDPNAWNGGEERRKDVMRYLSKHIGKRNMGRTYAVLDYRLGIRG